MYLSDQSGFSLVELMVSLAISMIVLAGATSLFTGQRKVYSIQEQVSDMGQNARGAMDFIVKKVRMMGYARNSGDNFDDFGLSDPLFNVSNTSVSDNVSIHFTCDAGGFGGVRDNGITDNVVGERYSFYLIGTDLMLGNIAFDTGQVLGGTILAQNIEFLNFVYVYSDGDLSSGPAGLPDDNDADITNNFSKVDRIIITVRGRTVVPDPDFGGDGFRRFTCTTSVTPRNLQSVL